MSLQPSTPSRFRIAVIGVGGIGSAFAFQLARAGHRVSVVARPGSRRLDQLRHDGEIVRVDGQKASVTVQESLEQETAFDLVLVTTLAHQVEAVLPALRGSRASNIQFMFNTFEPDRLIAAVEAQRCSLGMPFIMASLDERGRLDLAISKSRKTLHGDRRWAQLFQEAGIPSAFEPNMPLWLRCHVPLCVAMESVAIAGQRRGGGVSWGEAQTVARAAKAGFEVVRALGLPFYPASKRAMAALPRSVLATMLWTVSRSVSFRELLARGDAECRALVDALVAAASETEPSLPRAAAALTAARPDP